MPSKKQLENGKATTAVVGILNLQVILAQDGSSWYAQAIEFDYAAGGDSLDDVKKRFEAGLYQTLQEHFAMFGNIDKLISTRPDPAYWLDLVKQPGLVESKYSAISVHNFMSPHLMGFPYGTVKYYVQQDQIPQTEYSEA